MPDLPSLDDRWILARRGPRNRVSPSLPYAHLVEPERTAQGCIEDMATIFITNKECPFRCLMCDLWKNTTETRVDDGAVAAQIEWALKDLPWTPGIKLYNSGNFFDAQAIPRQDWPRIAGLLDDHRTVIVESHPRLVGPSCVEFAELIEPDLEVAMGLETVDPEVLPRLNKRMTLHDYERATRFLLDHGIPVRAFILLRTPFQSEREGVEWAMRSVDYAFSIGVQCCSIVPTRSGNGAMDWLQEHGHFHPPSLHSMERVLEYGAGLKHGRVFMDLWDVERFHDCPSCSAKRVNRLRGINLSQEVTPRILCSSCQGSDPG
ncbi:MAG: radical SAM protein [Planctomycetes bacterium]|nr:radical SAM protein [Planctomycetota bacterium]